MTNLVASFDGLNFGAGAVDDQDGIVFGGVFTPTRTYIAGIDLATGKLSEIAPASSRGFAWMSFADGWLAWPQDGVGGSSIQLWNAAKHERREIATSGPADAAVGDGEVAWIEPAGDQSSALRVFQLASGKTVSLDSGNLGAPVFAGSHLVWTKTEPGAQAAAFVFADAATLQPETVPAELAGVRGIANLGGSSQRLIWTASAGNRAWVVDDLSVAVIRTYPTGSHYAQFPQLADPYLAWFGAVTNSLVDLETGVGFDLPVPGSGIAIGGDTFVVVRLLRISGHDRTEVSVLHLSQLSRLQSCSPA